MITKYSYLLDGLEHRHFDTPMERDLKLRKLDAETETDTQRAYANKFPHMEHFCINQSTLDPIYHMQWEH